jgi:hypothetical protein
MARREALRSAPTESFRWEASELCNDHAETVAPHVARAEGVSARWATVVPLDERPAGSVRSPLESGQRSAAIMASAMKRPYRSGDQPRRKTSSSHNSGELYVHRTSVTWASVIPARM